MNAFGAAAAAEWTKLWSLRSTWWCLGTALVLQTAYAVLVGVDARYDLEESGGGATRLSLGDAGLLSVQFAQYALIAWALLAVTGEYSTGSISTTLRAVPVRGRALAAKAVVVTGVVAVVGLALMVVAAVGAKIAAGPYGELSAGAFVGDVATVMAYAAAIAVFTLGIGTALRSAVGGLTIVLMVAVVVPAVLGQIGLDWVDDVNEYLPGSAGVAVLYGGLSNPGDVPQPYGVATGLLVFGAWAAAALGVGYGVLRRRDA